MPVRIIRPTPRPGPLVRLALARRDPSPNLTCCDIGLPSVGQVCNLVPMAMVTKNRSNHANAEGPPLEERHGAIPKPRKGDASHG